MSLKPSLEVKGHRLGHPLWRGQSRAGVLPGAGISLMATALISGGLSGQLGLGDGLMLGAAVLLRATIQVNARSTPHSHLAIKRQKFPARRRAPRFPVCRGQWRCGSGARSADPRQRSFCAPGGYGLHAGSVQSTQSVWSGAGEWGGSRAQRSMGASMAFAPADRVNPSLSCTPWRRASSTVSSGTPSTCAQ